MKPQLHHVAINVNDIDWYCNFFQTVFQMDLRKTAGEKPHRQIWFSEGIQLNESEDCSDSESIVDHICIVVDDIPAYVALALQADCTGVDGKANWFVLPNGLKVELL